MNKSPFVIHIGLNIHLCLPDTQYSSNIIEHLLCADMSSVRDVKSEPPWTWCQPSQSHGQVYFSYRMPLSVCHLLSTGLLVTGNQETVYY